MRRLPLLSLLLAAWTVLGASPTLAEKSQRGASVMPQVAAGSVSIAGDYWALIIGIDQYQHVPKLQSAVKDAQAVREVLIQRYGFARDHVTEIINGQATRKNIEDALYQLRKRAGPTDSVFIYYAGHGQIDQEDQMGYWVPVEGEAQSPGTFISNDRIRGEVAKMKAKHVYFVADSCFSGSLFASGRALPPLNDKFFAKLYANKSRWGLTSGMNEPVTDQGKDGHSMFAYFFLKLLKENEDPYLVPSHIYDQIAPLIGRNTDQQPVSQPLQNAGDEGGQFVFRLASASGGLLPPPTSSGGASSDEMVRMKAELDVLKAQMSQPKAEISRPIEIAKAPAYEGWIQPFDYPKELHVVYFQAEHIDYRKGMPGSVKIAFVDAAMVLQRSRSGAQALQPLRKLLEANQQEELRKRQAEVVTLYEKRIEHVVARVAEKRGFELVLDSGLVKPQTNELLKSYVPEQVKVLLRRDYPDLTQVVIQELDITYGQKD